MALVRKTLDSARPPRFTEDELAAIDRLSPDEVERRARHDADNLPMTEAELRRVASSKMIRRVRRTTGLSQTEFAARFRIGLARLRDWEQGRFEPDSVAMAYLQVIEIAPKVVERALASALHD